MNTTHEPTVSSLFNLSGKCALITGASGYLGSAMARAAWGAFMAAAREVATGGSFTALESAEPFATFDNLFKA